MAGLPVVVPPDAVLRVGRDGLLRDEHAGPRPSKSRSTGWRWVNCILLELRRRLAGCFSGARISLESRQAMLALLAEVAGWTLHTCDGHGFEVAVVVVRHFVPDHVAHLQVLLLQLWAVLFFFFVHFVRVFYGCH